MSRDDVLKTAAVREESRDAEARELVLLMFGLIERMDRACARYGCTRKDLFRRQLEPVFAAKPGDER